MATVNLVPGTQYLAAARSRRNNLLVSAAGVAVVLLLVWGGLGIWSSILDKQASDLKKRAEALQTQLAQAKPVADRVSLFENRLGLVDTLLAKHTAVDPVLHEIERLIPGTISLNSLRVDVPSGSISLAGTAPTPDDVAQLLASLKSTASHPTLFSTADVKSINRGDVSQDGKVVGSNYSFSLVGTFNPADLQTIKTPN